MFLTALWYELRQLVRPWLNVIKFNLAWFLHFAVVFCIGFAASRVFMKVIFVEQPIHYMVYLIPPGALMLYTLWRSNFTPTWSRQKRTVLAAVLVVWPILPTLAWYLYDVHIMDFFGLDLDTQYSSSTYWYHMLIGFLTGIAWAILLDDEPKHPSEKPFPISRYHRFLHLTLWGGFSFGGILLGACVAGQGYPEVQGSTSQWVNFWYMPSWLLWLILLLIIAFWIGLAKALHNVDRASSVRIGGWVLGNLCVSPLIGFHFIHWLYTCHLFYRSAMVLGVLLMGMYCLFSGLLWLRHVAGTRYRLLLPDEMEARGIISFNLRRFKKRWPNQKDD